MEDAMINFEKNKEDLNDISAVYEEYLSVYYKITDNELRKTELNESIILYFQYLNQIKECIKKMNEFNDNKFVKDAVFIYETQMLPLLSKIRELKYKSNFVDKNEGNCNLNQKKFNSYEIYLSSNIDKIISFDIGLNIKSKKPIKNLEKQISENSINSYPNLYDNQIIPVDEQIFSDDSIYGVMWSNSKYQTLWER